jgi:hypothetical protein
VPVGRADRGDRWRRRRAAPGDRGSGRRARPRPAAGTGAVAAHRDVPVRCGQAGMGGYPLGHTRPGRGAARAAPLGRRRGLPACRRRLNQTFSLNQHSAIVAGAAATSEVIGKHCLLVLRIKSPFPAPSSPADWPTSPPLSSPAGEVAFGVACRSSQATDAGCGLRAALASVKRLHRLNHLMPCSPEGRPTCMSPARTDTFQAGKTRAGSRPVPRAGSHRLGPGAQSRLGVLTVRNPGRCHVRKTSAAHRSAMRPAPRAARRPTRRPLGPTRPAPGRRALPYCRSARRSGRRWSARR